MLGNLRKFKWCTLALGLGGIYLLLQPTKALFVFPSDIPSHHASSHLAPRTLVFELSADAIYNELQTLRPVVEQKRQEISFTNTLTPRLRFLMEAGFKQNVSPSLKQSYFTESVWWLAQFPTEENRALLSALIARVQTTAKLGIKFRQSLLPSIALELEKVHPSLVPILVQY